MAVTDPSVITATEQPRNGDRGGAAPDAATARREGAEIESIVGLMAAKLGADAALLTVYDGLPGEPNVYAAKGQPLGPTVHEGVTGGGSIGHALARGKPIAKRLRATSENGGGTKANGKIDGVVIAPVKALSGTTGALSLGWVEPLEDELEVVLNDILSYTALIGIWLDDPPSLVELLRTVYADGLTGCLTFPALLDELEREVRRCERTGRPLACLFIDLDRFKDVNDTDGHLIGNLVLAAIGQGMLERVRATDTVGRYGGDEFVALAPDTGTLEASLLADSLRNEIGEASTAALGRAVEASVGVAEWVPGMTATELLDKADEALGEARRRRGIDPVGRPWPGSAARACRSRSASRGAATITGPG